MKQQSKWESFYLLLLLCSVHRCLDIELDNKFERLQALRLIRQIMFLAPASFPQCLVRSLVSIAEGDHKETDRLRKICLAVLCELSKDVEKNHIK